MQKNNLQDIFLTKVRKQSLPVTVFLMNGFQMRGSVTGFDSFTVVLDTDGHGGNTGSPRTGPGPPDAAARRGRCASRP